MKSKLIYSALFRFRNIAALLGTLGMAQAINTESPGLMAQVIPLNSPYVEGAPFLASVVLYMALVIQSLTSKEFHESFNHKQKVKQIRELNNSCLRLALEAKKNTNPTYYKKLRKVMDDKNEIVNSFLRGERSYLKEKIVEQTLNLVVSYTKLLNNFCIRSKELSAVDVTDVANRINSNLRKLSFVNDPHAAEDLKGIIAIDEKVIDRLKEEKKDLERISAKLDYMESMVNMFKHQIISSVESEEMIEKLETAVNEAVALDSVLDERRKNRIRM
ncbi:MAG: hypothetical protein N3B21_12280 [Clostridia bacterium]|nr:hypothetical protein [Clostridia bacterium]